MNPIELGIFVSRIESICDEMGAILRRAAFSPNIKDRMDFSCAIFGPEGDLCAQAAHIPVHLGSMAYAMADIVKSIDWQKGDMVVLNDPYLGGTHLPDVTVIAPLFVSADVDNGRGQETLVGFIANRAHHANIGATSPGSMPISTTLEEEGMVIPPTILVRNGQVDEAVLLRISGGSTGQSYGDFSAQISANRVGCDRLEALILQRDIVHYANFLVELNAYGSRLARAALGDLPDGIYRFEDYLDDDGAGEENITIAATITIDSGSVCVDFSGTHSQVTGNVNCPLSVAAAAVYYVFRCLMPAHTPACAGTFSAISLRAKKGSLLDAHRPAAVAAGNVETSTRVVDVILGALAQAIPHRIPAASHGSMNNVAMGAVASAEHAQWDYYETIGGGMGAHQGGPGMHAVQTHMTNTLNTPIESLESHYPLRVMAYRVRERSGGGGQFVGGDGLERSMMFLAPATVTLLTERRVHAPWGLSGGNDGALGENRLNGELLPPKVAIDVMKGDQISIKTPGGGGWG
ncbi:5-oxoprolinase [Gammaproteobacteria bacterium 45_16_T64]|nr:5-oxoprolinase [Gammaproteobacteria bacterium 45_16_T64]